MRTDKLLNADQQIQKLNQATQLADTTSKSTDVTQKLGAFLLYAGITDFLVIQAARQIEQIMLKSQLAEGKTPTFQPHEEPYFYDSRISTRTILVGIEKLLPLHSPDPAQTPQAQRVTDLAKQMIVAGHRFLDYRIPIVHHIGHPKYTFDELVDLCNKANQTYQEFLRAHSSFLEAAQPYGFSEKEIEYFYGKQKPGQQGA